MLTNRYMELDTALADYESWYLINADRVPTFEAAVRFLRLAIDGRLFLLHLLRDELVPLRRDYTNDTDLDIALDSFSQWYASNCDTISDAGSMLMFLKKATDDSLHLIHLMRQELRTAQRQKAENSLLWLPTSLRI